MSVEQKLEMWDYWRDKKGYIEALENYYPAIVAEDWVIRQAFENLKMAQLLIDTRMKQLNNSD